MVVTEFSAAAALASKKRQTSKDNTKASNRSTSTDRTNAAAKSMEGPKRSTSLDNYEDAYIHRRSEQHPELGGHLYHHMYQSQYFIHDSRQHLNLKQVVEQQLHQEEIEATLGDEEDSEKVTSNASSVIAEDADIIATIAKMRVSSPPLLAPVPQRNNRGFSTNTPSPPANTIPTESAKRPNSTSPAPPLISSSSTKTRPYHLHCYKDLHGHEATVTCLAVVNYNTKEIISGSIDGTLRWWDVISGECLHIYRGHTQSVRCVIVFPLAMYGIASGSSDHTICIWNRLEAKDEIEKIQLALHGHHNLAKTTEETENETENNTEDVTETEKDDDTHIVSSGDTAHGQRGKGGSHSHHRHSHTHSHTRSHTHKPLAKSPLLKIVLRGHTGTIYTLSTLEHGRLASGSADKTIRIWNTNIVTGEGQCERILTGHNYAVSHLLTIRNQELVSNSHQSNTLRIWNRITAPTHLNHGHPVITHSQGSDKQDNSSDRGRSTPSPSPSLHSSTTSPPPGGTSASSGTNPEDDIKRIKTCHGHKKRITVLTSVGHLNPQDAHRTKQFITASEDETIRIWNCEDEPSIFSWTGSISSCCKIHCVEEYEDIDSYTLVKSKKTTRFVVKTLAWINQKHFITYCTDDRFRLFHIDGHLLESFNSIDGSILSVDQSPYQEKHVIPLPNKAKTDVENTTEQPTASTNTEHKSQIRSLITLDAKWFVSGSNDAHIKVWLLEHDT